MGAPVAGLVDIDLLDDHLEASEPVLRRPMRASMKAHRFGRTLPVRKFLDELKGQEPTQPPPDAP
jgi:hypothetical protein